MKTLVVLIASLVTGWSQAGFADSIDLSGNCCTTSQEMIANASYKQQIMLDQLQVESQSINVHAVPSMHQIMEQRMNNRKAEQTLMNSIQEETELITADHLVSLTLKVKDHVSNQVDSASR